ITYGRVLFFCFFCSSYCLLRDFHSFPTRRSSDLFRNLDDQQLAALKKNKGVIGVNFYSDFLDSGYVNRVEELYYRDHPRAGQGETAPSIGKMYASLSPADQHRANTPMENLLQHIDYLVSKVGIDHVAIG